jgi:two-component system chemotaxis response regulator CheY
MIPPSAIQQVSEGMRLARVFIIGHNLLIRTLLREVLAGAGHQIVGEGTEGPETLDRVLGLRPQLVVLDTVLVRADTLATLDSLHRIDPEMAVVVCSALLERSYAIGALQRGVNGFIVKPFDRQTVIDATQRALTNAYGDQSAAASTQPTPPSALAEPTALSALTEPTALSALAEPTALSALTEPTPPSAVTEPIPASSPPQGGVEELRDFVRLGAELPVIVTPDGAEPIDTVTTDVSGGGMLLATGSLVLGTGVDFRLVLGAGEAPLAGRARVVRITDDGQSGLQFEQVSIADHERLTRYIATRASGA